MKRPEILAPAGSMKAMEAAIKAGADAVYMGGSRFGARAYADNPDKDELTRAIRYVHLYGKKIYLTLNTLLKEEEIDQVGDFLLPYYRAGLDGIIIQDPGVFSYVKKNFPGLALHASTQMNITDAAGARLLKEAGACRVVPARELSFEEIRAIKEETGLEIETFVHGALCYCYSGRCLMSSILGGRSGNRGRCAQPCRLPYEVDGNKEGSYVLSPKDLCTISLIPELCQAGIDSFKIEGRMKSPEYVATIVSIYKKYLDLYLADPKQKFEVKEEDWQALLEAFNRGGFTKGYYEQHNGKDMMSMERPNHQGISAGVIESIKDGKIYFRPQIEIHKGDLLEVELPEGKENITLTSPSDCKKGERFSLNARKLSDLKKGFPIYRTGNPWRKNQLEETLLGKEKKIGIYGTACFFAGENARLILTTEDGMTICQEGALVSEAKEKPITEEALRKPLMQTGTSRFEFVELRIEKEESCFVPLGAVKQLRRQAFEALEEALMDRGMRSGGADSLSAVKETSGETQKKERTHRPEIRVSFEDSKMAEILLECPEVDGIYLPLDDVTGEERKEILRKTTEKGKKIYYALPYVFRKEIKDSLEKQWHEIVKEKPSGLLLRNIDQFAWVREKRAENSWEEGMEIILDHSLYSYNKEAAWMYRDWMKEEVTQTFPLELNRKELLSLSLPVSELLVFGRIPLMVSAQCVTKSTGRCCKTPGYEKMTDRYQKNFYVRRHCRYCYNTIWNGVPLSLQGIKEELAELSPDSIRLHFTIEKEKEIKRIVRTFYEEWNDMDVTSPMKGEFTRGHYKRGIE